MYTIIIDYRYCCSFYAKKTDNRTLRCHYVLNSYLLILKLQTNTTTITASFLCDRNLLVWRHKARLNENLTGRAVNTSVLKY
jgi:hypothetical protein